MKILFISTMGGFPWGGSEELWHNVAINALQNKNEVFICTKEWETIPPKIVQLREAGAQIFHWTDKDPGQNTSNKFLRKLKKKILGENRNKLLSKLDSIKPDRLCISQGGTFDLLYRKEIIQYIYDNPSLNYFIICQFCMDYGVKIPYKSAKQANVFKNAAKIFFVSERNKLTAERALVQKLNNAVIVNNPVNLSGKRALPYPAQNKTVNFAIVARLEYDYKGQDLLLEVLSKTQWHERSWKLNLYGKGPDEEYLKDLAEYFKISDKVFFHGHVKNIEGVWEDNNILLLPSIAEGLPLALCEAMLCARPAIVTDVAGNTELIEEGVNGFVAEGPQIKYIEAAMERAWNSKDTWEEMGKLGYLKAMQKYKNDTGSDVYSLISEIK